MVPVTKLDTEPDEPVPAAETEIEEIVEAPLKVEEPAKKVIGTPALAGGGKLNPADYPYPGLLDDEKEKGPPSLVVIERQSGKIPTTAYIVNAELAKAIVDGKQAAVSKVADELVGQPLLLVTAQKALGTVTLGKSDGLSCPVERVTVFQRAKGTNIAEGAFGVVNDVRLIDKKKATVHTDSIDKLRDRSKYTPSRVADATLRTDFRIVMHWLAKAVKAKEATAELEKVLHKLLKEAAARGSETMQFNPKGMTKDVRPLFLKAATAAGVPREMFKAVKLTKSTDPDELTNAELVEAHESLHGLHNLPVAKGWSSADLVNLHARVVDVMKSRGVEHPDPPVDQLDPVSAEFETETEVAKMEVEAELVEVTKAVPKAAPGKVSALKVGVFRPLPTATPAQPSASGKQQISIVNGLVKVFEKDLSLFPTHLQKMHGDVRVQIHKSGEAVTVFDGAGADRTSRLPGLVAEVKALAPKQLVLDATLEMWKRRRRCSDEKVLAYLATTEKAAKADDTSIVATVTDALYFGKSLVAWPTHQRMKKVGELKLSQSTMGIPSLKSRLNAAPTIAVKDLEQLERVSRAITNQPGSVGVVAKGADAVFPAPDEEGAVWIGFRTPFKTTTEKQADPYMEVPDENETYRFVVQQHWLGKDVKTELRHEVVKGKRLLGWVINAQKNMVTEPIISLRLARAAAPAKVSKVDWSSGAWKPGLDLLAQRREPHPFPWLDSEGKTPDPRPGKAAPVGASIQYPGVYHIVDQGELEYGAQKPWVHEYFVRGAGLNQRVLFRRLRFGALNKARHSYTKCMECTDAAPEIDVLWADGRGRAWFCKACYPKWLKKVGGKKAAEVIGTKAIVGGNAPINFNDVHKKVVTAKSAQLHPILEEISKRLPVSSGGSIISNEAQWLAISPGNNTPNVVTPDAVAKQWIPPLGVSALPKAVRAQVPEAFHYWKAKTLDEARTTRDSLVKALGEGKVELDFDAPFEREEKSPAKARFVLQKHEQGEEVSHQLRLDIGARELVVAKLSGDPSSGAELTASVGFDSRLASMDLSGDLKAGHYVNMSKSAASRVSVLDSGGASVELKKDTIRAVIQGEKISGGFEVRKADDGSGQWVWAPFDAVSDDSSSEIEKRAAVIADEARFVPIQKVDTDKRLVTGVVLEPGEVDAQNDTVSADVIEKAAHKFLARFQDKTQLGLMHKSFGAVGLELVESWVAPMAMKLGGKRVKKGSWLMTMKVVSDQLWKKTKAGQFTGFSIGGIATVA